MRGRLAAACLLFMAGCRTPAPPPMTSDRLLPVDAAHIEASVRAQAADLVLVNVWATWCAPCLAEMPDLVRVGEDYRARGLGLLFLTVDGPEDHAAALGVLTKVRARPPYYARVGSDEAFIAAFGLDWSGTLPATALYDRAGTLLAFWEGPVDYATLRDVLEVVEWP